MRRAQSYPSRPGVEAPIPSPNQRGRSCQSAAGGHGPASPLVYWSRTGRCIARAGNHLNVLRRAAPRDDPVSVICLACMSHVDGRCLGVRPGWTGPAVPVPTPPLRAARGCPPHETQRPKLPSHARMDHVNGHGTAPPAGRHIHSRHLLLLLVQLSGLNTVIAITMIRAHTNTEFLVSLADAAKL